MAGMNPALWHWGKGKTMESVKGCVAAGAVGRDEQEVPRT